MFLLRHQLFVSSAFYQSPPPYLTPEEETTNLAVFQHAGDYVSHIARLEEREGQSKDMANETDNQRQFYFVCRMAQQVLSQASHG